MTCFKYYNRLIICVSNRYKPLPTITTIYNTTSLSHTFCSRTTTLFKDKSIIIGTYTGNSCGNHLCFVWHDNHIAFTEIGIDIITCILYSLCRNFYIWSYLRKINCCIHLLFSFKLNKHYDLLFLILPLLLYGSHI